MHTARSVARPYPLLDAASQSSLILVLTVLLAGWLALPAGALSQATGDLAGTVTDAETGAPLAGVNVVLPALDRGAATGADGQFVINDLPTGRHELEARFVGYATATRTVVITADAMTRLRLTLRPASVALSGVEVTALRPDLQPTGEVSEERVREMEPADTGSLLRGVPGANAVRRGALGFDPNVRGLSETEVGVYIDGMRTFPAGPLRMDSPLSHVDPSSVKSIQVVKGPYALTWGPGNMSAIRVEKRGDNPPRTPITGSVRTGYDTNRQAVTTTGFAMGRQGAVSYAVNGAWRRGSDYTAGNGTVVEGDYTTGEGRARLGVALADAMTIEASGGYQEQQDLKYPGRLLNADFFRTGTGQLHFDYAPDSGVLQRLDVRAHAQQTLHRMTNEGKPTFEAGRFPNGNPRPPLRISVNAEIQNFGGRAVADLALGETWDVTLGGDVLQTYRNATRPFTVVQGDGSQVTPPFYTSDRVWPGVTVAQEGAFARVSRPLGPLQVAATGRLDFAQTDAARPSDAFLRNADATTSDLARSYAMLSGAATLAVPLGETFSLSLGAGSVARPPDALELYADRFPASKAQTSAEFQGNPFLEPERSTQFDLWLEGDGRRWTAQVNGFARRLDPYVTLAPTDLDPLLPLSPETVFRYVNGTAVFYGGEAQAAVQPTPALTLRASGSYLWGQDTTLDEPALGVAPLSGALGARWQLPVDGPTLSNVYLDGSVQRTAAQERVARTRGETPTDGYTTVDLRAGATLFRRATLEVSAQNLFDVAYANHLNARNPFAAMDAGQDRVLEPGRLISTTLTVRF
jgi:iron complex outermembrane receptor protein